MGVSPRKDKYEYLMRNVMSLQLKCLSCPLGFDVHDICNLSQSSFSTETIHIAVLVL